MFAPSFQAAFERAYSGDALFSEEERHTGARGFVWSSAIENDFTIVGQQIVFLLQFLGIHAEGAGDGFRVGFKIHGMSQVDDDEVFAGVKLLLQFFDGDPGDAKRTQEALARQKFVAEIGCERGNEYYDEPATERGGAFGDALDLAAEEVAEAKESASPEDGASAIEKEEAPGAHLKDSGERRSDRAEARKEFGEEQGACALLGEDPFGASDTGIRLDGNLAKKLKDFDAFAKAELIPE